jgi:hypothetical protein
VARPSAGPRSRLLDGLAWTAAFAAGVLVLLPSTVEWVRGLDAEEVTRRRADAAEQRAREAAQHNLWLEQDPAADDKLRDAEAAAARKRKQDQ